MSRPCFACSLIDERSQQSAAGVSGDIPVEQASLDLVNSVLRELFDGAYDFL